MRLGRERGRSSTLWLRIVCARPREGACAQHGRTCQPFSAGGSVRDASLRALTHSHKSMRKTAWKSSMLKYSSIFSMFHPVPPPISTQTSFLLRPAALASFICSLR